MMEGSGKEAGEEQKKLILQPIPIKLNPSATAQATKSPLPAAPSTNPMYLVYILSAAQPIPEEPAPAAEAKAIPLSLPMQYFRKSVASVQTFATTSKTLAATHTAWHSGWFGCWFRFGAPGP